MKRHLSRCVIASVAVGAVALLGAALTDAGAASAARQWQPAPAASAVSATGPRLAPAQLKIMNWYPSRTPWSKMWTSYDHAKVDSDMAAMSSLGANTVRVIVQPYAVGWPTVSSTGAADFADVISTAAKHGLSTMLTLFDGWGTYNQVPLSEQWVNSLLSGYRNDARIALIEIQNELPFATTGAVPWAQTMLTYLRQVVPSAPRTVSFSGTTTPAQITSTMNSFGSQYVDVVDLHLYSNFQDARMRLVAGKQAAAGRPLIVGEAGVSTGTDASLAAQETQAAFYTQLQRLCATLGVPVFAPWILNDIDGGPGQQQTYGIRTLTGQWKVSAGVVRRMFNNLPTTAPGGNLLSDRNFNYASDQPNSLGSLGAWIVTSRTNLGAGGATTVGAPVGRFGYLHSAYSDSAGWPALTQSCVLDANRHLTLSARVRLIAGTGLTVIGVSYYDANGALVGSVTSPAAVNQSSDWQSLSLTSTAPATAITVTVGLKSVANSGTAEFDKPRLQESA